MNEELFEELNAMKDDLNISDKTFLKMIKYALEYIKSNNLPVENLFEIVCVIMEIYDYDSFGYRKKVRTAYKLAVDKLGYNEDYVKII